MLVTLMNSQVLTNHDMTQKLNNGVRPRASNTKSAFIILIYMLVFFFSYATFPLTGIPLGSMVLLMYVKSVTMKHTRYVLMVTVLPN